MVDDPTGYSAWGEGMGWIVRLIETDPAGRRRSVDVMEIDRPGDLDEIGNLGLSLAEGKQLLECVQQDVVAAQAREHAGRRPRCGSCGARCQVKDYRTRQVDTAFGRVAMRLPHFRCAECGETMAGVDWPSHCRSTPELDRLRAYLSALMSSLFLAGARPILRVVATTTLHQSVTPIATPGRAHRPAAS
jgi:hypothetical protein